MTNHRTLTVIADVRPGREAALRQLVESYGDSVQDPASPLGFGRCPSLHFARWVLLNPPRGRPGAPTRLLFCASFDDIPEAERAREVVRAAAGPLDEIYAHCEKYPAHTDRTDAARERYLTDHAIRANAIFVGAPDRTLRQIRDEAMLRDGIQGFLNGRDFAGRSARDVAAEVRDFVSREPKLQWALTPPPPRRRTLPHMILFGAGILVSVPWILVWLLVLRLFYERTDRPTDLMPSGLDPDLLRRLERIEDLYPQNQFSQLMDVKPGRFRQLTLRMVLWATDFLSRNFFTEGQIGRIPTIHFASWTLIDGDTRLLFQSNFDGSWDSYLGDFIDKAAMGLNAFLSNCVGFPRTWFLFFKGVKDVEHYKAWARNANIPTQAWYTAYPDLSVKNVNANSRIRRGLQRPMTESEAAEWIRSL
jgi:hypothetical protein